MTSKVLTYKGQIGSVEWDMENDCLYGQLLHINDLVTYEARTPAELKVEFEAAVDDYLETCEELGVEPNKPFKGTFNVRIGSGLHKEIAYKAAEKGISINDAITQAVTEYVADISRKRLIDDVGDQIRKHVYQASLYASEMHQISEPRPSARIWSETFVGLKGTYSIKPDHAHEH